MVAAAVAACGDIDGGKGDYPGTTVYESPGKDFHFHLLEPPWIPIKLPTNEVFFVVPPEGTISITAAQEADAAYTLHIALQNADAATAFLSHATAQWNLAQKRVFTTPGADAGVEIDWQESTGVYHREADITGSVAGTSYQLRFTSKTSMVGNPFVEQMIVSFEPRAVAASRVGP